VLERSVLAGLQTELMRDELVNLFIAEFKAELDRITAGANAGMEAARREIATVERQIRAIIEAVKQGFASSTLRDELDVLERRKDELSRSATRPAPVPVLHPNLAELTGGRWRVCVKRCRTMRRRRKRRTCCAAWWPRCASFRWTAF
jgi:site-specific DNA recombinase